MMNIAGDLPVEAEQVFGTLSSSQNTILLRGSYRTDDGVFSASPPSSSKDFLRRRTSIEYLLSLG
jgi:hypothetical protein